MQQPKQSFKHNCKPSAAGMDSQEPSQKKIYFSVQGQFDLLFSSTAANVSVSQLLHWIKLSSPCLIVWIGTKHPQELYFFSPCWRSQTNNLFAAPVSFHLWPAGCKGASSAPGHSQAKQGMNQLFGSFATRPGWWRASEWTVPWGARKSPSPLNTWFMDQQTAHEDEKPKKPSAAKKLSHWAHSSPVPKAAPCRICAAQTLSPHPSSFMLCWNQTCLLLFFMSLILQRFSAYGSPTLHT